MKMIGLALIVAVIVEAIIEYGQTVYDMVAEADYKKAVKQGLAIIVAILFAFQLKVTLLSWMISGTFDVVVNPAFDMVISGIFMSRGANYLSDLIRMIFRIGSNNGDGDDFWDAFDFEEDDDEPAEKSYED